MKKPYTKENVMNKLKDSEEIYAFKSHTADGPSERIANQIAETVIKVLIAEFEKEFE